MFSVSAKGRLTHRDVGRFPGNTLFDRLARVVCEAGCLPRKELYESWEMARRIRRRLRGGRVVDLAAGHGLLSHVLLLLDDSSPEALLVDTAPPPSAARLHGVLVGSVAASGGSNHLASAAPWRRSSCRHTIWSCRATPAAR